MAKVGTGKYTGSAQAFILWYEEQIDLYNSMARTDEAMITEDQAMGMIQNAVAHQRELAMVSTTLDSTFITTGKPADFHMYRSLLLSACATEKQVAE